MEETTTTVALSFKPPYKGAKNVIASLSDSDYISYNPDPCKGIAFLQPDDSSGETAIRFDGKWFILRGDWRQRYSDAWLAGGIKAALQLYQDNDAAHGSTWSTGTAPLKWLAARMEAL